MSDDKLIATMDGVREYTEEYPVELWTKGGRPTVVAYNEATHNSTEIDLQDLLAWIKVHLPALREGEPEQA